MSSFKCEICNTPIIDSPSGYITECLHWPIKILKESNYTYFITEDPVKGFTIGKADKKKKTKGG